ncbi:MAG TPA: peptide-methionine (R)-S-oxide reductase MsrB [Microvirga sp.]|jgi:peptide-methionine (R)-S-oxide reductase
MPNRRTFLLSGIAACGGGLPWPATSAPKARFEITRTNAEWKRLLTPDQYAVLRNEDTEQAGSSPLNAEKRTGVYHCAGCDLPVYSSHTKFESGTGWPSFYASLDGAVGTRKDRKLVFMVRTEVHCRRCGGHLGHIFDDGPPPTGMRHCLNGVALTFKPLEG